MDGLPLNFPLQVIPGSGPAAIGTATAQRTLKTSIGCVGVGVHSGQKANLTLHPAPAGTGIVFRRTDLGPAPGIDIPARFDNVVETRLCTVLGLPGRTEARIGTVEHVMAALQGSGISNAIVAVDGPEVPILDGSAASFLFLIDCAGIAIQDLPAAAIEIRRSVRVTDEAGEAFAELHPASCGPDVAQPDHAQLDLSLSIDFPATAIGRQEMGLRFTRDAFRSELARARTFTLAHEVAALHALGLALGGSLDNAVVVEGDKVLNPGGLRMADEFVRHKLLDVIGDLALAGATLRGRFVGYRSGHALNNRLLRALFADPANWRLVPGLPAPAEVAGFRPTNGSSGLPGLSLWQERHLPVAAAPV